MPVLFAYLLTISIFIGGGYAGLHFLAGDFDTPPLPAKAEKVRGEKSEARQQLSKARPASGRPVEVAAKSPEVEAVNTADKSVLTPVQPAPPEVQPITSSAPSELVAHSIPAEPAGQTPRVVVAERPAAAETSAPVAEQPLRTEPAQTRETAAEQVASAGPETSKASLPAQRAGVEERVQSDTTGSNHAESVRLPRTVERRASVKSAPRRKEARRLIRERSATAGSSSRREESIPRPLVPRGSEPMATDFFGRTTSRSEPVRMVLRTIELPNGRRFRQLLTEGQADLDN